MIYEHTARTGHVPTMEETASASRLGVNDVRAACHALADAHVLILRSDRQQLWAAPPFSAVPTPFRVLADGRSFYAPCAWDAFGIPAALNEDVAIEARCAWSTEVLRVGVRNGESYGDALIHLEVPARHFWDDIIYT
jgi:alkylmercury lyase-like protein